MSKTLSEQFEEQGLTGYELQSQRRKDLENQEGKNRQSPFVRGLVHVVSLIGAGVFCAVLAKLIYLNAKDVRSRDIYNQAIMEHSSLIDTNGNGIDPEELGRFHYKISRGKEDITLGKGKDYWPMRNGKRVSAEEVAEWIRRYKP